MINCAIIPIIFPNLYKAQHYHTIPTSLHVTKECFRFDIYSPLSISKPCYFHDRHTSENRITLQTDFYKKKIDRILPTHYMYKKNQPVRTTKKFINVERMKYKDLSTMVIIYHPWVPCKIKHCDAYLIGEILIFR